MSSPATATRYSPNVEDAIAFFPRTRQFIEKHSVTPLHLTLGLVPPNCPIEEFRQIRRQFKSALASPEFVLLAPESSATDVRSFLISIGMPEEKIRSLPPGMTYTSYMERELGEGWDEEDLDLLTENALLARDNIQRGWCHAGPGVLKEIRKAYKLLFGQDADLDDDLLGMSKWCPKSISPLPHPQMPEVEPENFDLPYRDAGQRIMTQLCHDINDRVSKQVCTPGTNFENMPVYAPIVHLTNASGTCKTRAALELGKATNVLLLKFGKGKPRQVFRPTRLLYYVVPLFSRNHTNGSTTYSIEC